MATAAKASPVSWLRELTHTLPCIGDARAAEDFLFSRTHGHPNRSHPRANRRFSTAAPSWVGKIPLISRPLDQGFISEGFEFPERCGKWHDESSAVTCKT